MALRIGAFICMIWLCLSVAPSCVRAQSDRTTDERAKLLFAQGVVAASEQRWRVAEQLFERSIELAPKSATFLNLALVRSRLGKPRDAMRALDAFDEVVAQEDLMRKARWLRSELEAKLQHKPDAIATSDPVGPPEPWNSTDQALELSPLPWHSAPPAELLPVPWSGQTP